jgi:REP element-mobilizing transposase RayT
MKDDKIFETIADISYIAGYKNHYSGNSRFDIFEYISWAKEFEKIHKNTVWNDEDYLLTVEKFTIEKIMQSIQDNIVFD